MQLFRHILQYLRTVKDGQDFVLPERLDSRTLAAIAAEAQFYGFTHLQATLQQYCSRTDSQAKLLQAQQRLGEQYEYKYIKVWDNSVAYYAPQTGVNGSGGRFWRHVTPDSADIGAEGGLQYLRNQGWELYSHAAAGGDRPYISLVFRRLSDNAGVANAGKCCIQ